MTRWYVPFNSGLKVLTWPVFNDKYLAAVLKMAGLTQTPVTRTAAVHILIAAAKLATNIDANTVTSRLLNAYLDLVLDPDPQIRELTLSDARTLVPKLSAVAVDEQVFPEVIASRDILGSSRPA